jgi:hypothetical protein
MKCLLRVEILVYNTWQKQSLGGILPSQGPEAVEAVQRERVKT